MLKTTAVLIAVLIGAVLAFAATVPDTFRVERSVTIAASPDAIFPLLNDFRAWRQWSPWEKSDPEMKRMYSGPQSGLGARYSWESNGDAGQGSMEIVKHEPSSALSVDLNFRQPITAHNTTDFILTPNDHGTEVRWVMSGRSPLLVKIVQLVFDMDQIVGKDFERGLSALKLAAEQR